MKLKKRMLALCIAGCMTLVPVTMTAMAEEALPETANGTVETEAPRMTLGELVGNGIITEETAGRIRAWYAPEEQESGMDAGSGSVSPETEQAEAADPAQDEVQAEPSQAEPSQAEASNGVQPDRDQMRRGSAGSRGCGQTRDARTPGMNGQTPGMNGQTPGMNGQAPNMNGQTPGTNGQAPNMNGQAPNMNGRTPGMNGQAPNMDGQTPGTNGQTPNMNGRMPGMRSQMPGMGGRTPQTNDGADAPRGMDPRHTALSAADIEAMVAEGVISREEGDAVLAALEGETAAESVKTEAAGTVEENSGNEPAVAGNPGPVEAEAAIPAETSDAGPAEAEASGPEETPDAGPVPEN